MTSLTFRTQSVLLGLVPVLLATVLLGTVADRSAHQALEKDAIRAVGFAATARREALLDRLGRQRDRARAFLGAILQHCTASSPQGQSACVAGLLPEYLHGERALAARVSLPGLAAKVEVGSDLAAWAATEPLPPGQLARVEPATAGAPRRYDLAVQDQGALLEVRFGVESIGAIFQQRYGLGETGETFLADSRGLFITPPRHPGHSGELSSHPIDARPMVACLSGKDSEMLAQDYRDADVIHGFRFIPQIGGGCIMAHIEQGEAFAPADALRSQIALLAGGCGLLALALSLLFARQLATPIARLSRRVEALEAGSPVAELAADGPREVQALAASFGRMARSVKSSLDLRGEALERETEGRRAAELLAEEVQAQSREVEEALRTMRAEKEHAEERLAQLTGKKQP